MQIEIVKYQLEVEFITPVLGTQPTKEVASEYIGSKFVDNGGSLPEDELSTLSDEIEKGTTVFHKLDEKPIIYDYHVKAFLKEAGRIFNGLNDVKNLRSKIENFVFIKPRQIALEMPEGSVVEYLERPLRADTAQGPRIALARSEMLPVGTQFKCGIEVYRGPIEYEILFDLLSYGENKGFLQWRNGGYGRFKFNLIK